MRPLFAPLTLLFLLGPPSIARATVLGIDMNQPIADAVPNTDALDALATARAPFVRVAFNRDVWTGPTDATKRGPRSLTWFEAYDELLDGYLARGIQVYGLVNDRITTSSAAEDSDEWQTAYVESVVALVDHFKDRVRVFEIYNEPNNWVSKNTPALAASPFAHLLSRTYKAVKLDHAGDRCWQVQLNSGPLFSSEDTTAADYLGAAYDAGRASWGWNDVVPFDGVGYHIYVAQGATETTSSVASKVTGNLSAVWNVIANNEGGGTAKRLWVSEMGWRTGPLSPPQQRDFMKAGVDALDAFGKVELGVYFSMQDFGADNEWGIFTGPPYDVAHEKTAYTGFTDSALVRRPSHAAFSVGITTPPSVAAGATAHVVVKMKNDGTQTWTRDAGVRLGAGPGCPESRYANAVMWQPADGYVTSLTDARAFLANDVAPGDVAELAFDVVAPSTPGAYRVSARMVAEGVEWFGTPVDVMLQVVPGGSTSGGTTSGGVSSGGSPGGSPGNGSVGDGSGSGTGAQSASSGCACRAGASRSEGLLSAAIALAAMLLRRRRV